MKKNKQLFKATLAFAALGNRINFLTKKLEIFKNLCRYGKQKGWLEIPPVYKN
jgi:hypothetical protein